jgi:hypothetical protein
VAQGVGPEFKPQYHKKKKKREREREREREAGCCPIAPGQRGQKERQEWGPKSRLAQRVDLRDWVCRGPACTCWEEGTCGEEGAGVLGEPGLARRSPGFHPQHWKKEKQTFDSHRTRNPIPQGRLDWSKKDHKCKASLKIIFFKTLA